MINFNKKDSVAEEVTKILAQEAELSHKQKRIAALAGDKKAIDALDLAALRAGKKPVDVEEGFGEMDKYLKDKEKEKGTGKYDKKKISTGTVYQKKHNAPKEDEKDDMKEEVEELDELKKSTVSSYVQKKFAKMNANPSSSTIKTDAKGIQRAASRMSGIKATQKEEVEELDERAKWRTSSIAHNTGYRKDGAHGGIENTADTGKEDLLKNRFMHSRYGSPTKSDIKGLKKSITKNLSQMKKEEVEQIDEISKETAGKYLTAPQGKGANKYKTGEGKSSYPNADTMLKHGKSVSRAVQRAGTGMSKKPSYYKEEEEQIDETVSRKHFQQVADLIKSHDSAEKRKELAQHHASIFKTQNPRFDHAKFMKAAGVNEGSWAEEVDTDVRTQDMLKGPKSTKQKDDVGPGSDGKSTKVRYHAGPHPSNEEVELDERTLTAAETKKKEHMVMSMKPKLKDFKKRYGERAKEVLYATATKRAKGE